MTEKSKIRLAMIAQRMRTLAFSSADNMNGKDVIIIYPSTLEAWSREIFEIIEYELELQDKSNKKQ